MNNDDFLRLSSAISRDISRIDLHLNIMYTVLITMHTLTFTQAEPLPFLFPILIILSIFNKNMEIINGIHRMSTYIMVFLETENTGWETRVYTYDILSGNYFILSARSYRWCIALSTSLCTLFSIGNIYTWAINNPQICNVNTIITNNIINIAYMTLSIMITIICWIYISYREKSYYKTKDEQLILWKEIKESETQLIE